MAAFIVSSFGLFVMGLFAELFTTPSEQTFTVLAYGWAVASEERQTITTYLWLTGATSVKHLSCFYRFLGGALYQARWQMWARIIRGAAQWVSAEAVIVLSVDDSTKKKAGRQIDGVGHYRNGVGSTRQEYRTLRGLNFVWGQMHIPLPGWPGQSVSVPIGLSLYLKEEQARKLHVPYQSRSALARELVDFVAAQLPTRRIRVLGDGGYATKDTLQQLPAQVDAVSRMLITGKLYALPPHGPSRAGGVRQRKAPFWGHPKPWRANGRVGSPIPPKPGHSSKRGRGCGIRSCRGDWSGWWCAVRCTSKPVNPATASRCLRWRLFSLRTLVD
jgi:hypothetical protein